MSRPIIFVHRGFSDYLDGVLALTRNYNRDKRIIMLGDEANRNISLKYSVEHYNFSDYDEAIPYHHVSVNPELYEKFCFSRWFVIKNFLTAHNIETFVHSDSDNAILIDIDRHTVLRSCIGSNRGVIVPNILFSTKEDMIAICAFYKTLYSLSYADFLKKILERPDLCIITHNGAQCTQFSDMMLIGLATGSLGLDYESLNENVTGEYCFNLNFNKYAIELKDGKAFVKGTNTYLFNIHFAGTAKQFVKDYSTTLLRQAHASI